MVLSTEDKEKILRILSFSDNPQMAALPATLNRYSLRSDTIQIKKEIKEEPISDDEVEVLNSKSSKRRKLTRDGGLISMERWVPVAPAELTSSTESSLKMLKFSEALKLEPSIVPHLTEPKFSVVIPQSTPNGPLLATRTFLKSNSIHTQPAFNHNWPSSRDYMLNMDYELPVYDPKYLDKNLNRLGNSEFQFMATRQTPLYAIPFTYFRTRQPHIRKTGLRFNIDGLNTTRPKNSTATDGTLNETETGTKTPRRRLHNGIPKWKIPTVKRKPGRPRIKVELDVDNIADIEKHYWQRISHKSRIRTKGNCYR